MEEGVGNAPTSGLSRSCFRDRRSQLVSACLPEMVRVVPQARDTSVLFLPRWWPRANARLLLTLHPEKWLPDLDSHQDKRFNRPPCYFDTTWPRRFCFIGLNRPTILHPIFPD